MCSCSTSPRRISISATRSTCCEYFATFRNRGMWLSSCPSTNSSSRRKSADKVICVKDGRVFRAGAPEDIFTRETIGELYGLQHGTFNESFGSVEIGRPHGDAHTFVIAAQVRGRLCFRQLIRQGKAFYAGVLHEGDIDCELARDLATECVAERAFEPIGDKTIARAKELLVHCARLIVCPARHHKRPQRRARRIHTLAWYRGHASVRRCIGGFPIGVGRINWTFI